jgi:hypothetical protein
MRTVLASLCLASSLLACATSEDETTPDDYQVVPDGKEDNFRSPTTQEFTATSTARVVLSEADRTLTDAQRLDKANELVSAKLLQIGWFLNLYVADKEDEDKNKSYGGFHAMARNSSVKSLQVRAVDAVTFEFNFEATIAAQNKFLTLLPGTASGGGKKIDLAMGAIGNDQLLAGTWQSAYDVHTWDPNTQPASSVEKLPMLVKASTRSSNAYLDYNRLYADGKLDVGAQFGWDYNAGREDLANAEQLYNDLVGAGFASPVGSFAALKIDSAPLTRKSVFNGHSVDVSVKIVHPGMVASPSADALQLRNALLDIFATKEVVLFNGHAGVSGRLLPADFQTASAGNILPTEYPTMRLRDGYQVVLIEGCQTYARFTDGFKANPAKHDAAGNLKDMDIVTSTSYTWTSQGAESMEDILMPLIGESATDNIAPATWDDILRAMNTAPNNTSFMGVNGIDSDPHRHPYANASTLGKTCTTSATCGGAGNVCLKSGTAKVCGSVCLDDAGCATGYRCSNVANAGTLSGKACTRR